ncbi:hypothetical protein PENVUL_c010G01054 [Penicillium vulpinum]|uniref:Uncharacterized protein n=1 Tax=Penicillium vulpinum TaxID=29845 RepID=A0A1V6S3M3_9EURO|nr:hypothetical protein PENVUL_c010G01054 [Penicillium vulpinum]
MGCPTFLAKHPAYLCYVREVASGELVMPEYERDEKNHVILQVGEQYCRYLGCTVSDHPYLTGNLRKHVGRHSEDVQVADGVTGLISFIEQEKVRAW